MKTHSSSQFYDKFSIYYRDYSHHKNLYIDAIDNIIASNISKPIENMLDIGCADGIRGHELFIKINAKKLTMVDNSKKMLRLAKKFTDSEVLLLDITNSKRESLNKKYDLIVCLWNVFGHIKTQKKRLKALQNIKQLVKKDGTIVVDISNRYNADYYGDEIVAENINKDFTSPSSKNGDVYPNLHMTEKLDVSYFCHFFSPLEFDSLVKQAGLKVKKNFYVNYNTGKIETSFLKGQLLYFLSI
jgi:2-polyprenyl-3-methyl-5-hydroxy-6-metoxy-1,4-benzoquinol methylase